MGIGVDLILLAIDDKNGVVRNQRLLGAGLAAADLVELALTHHVILAGARLAVRDAESEPPREELLKASLAELSSNQWPTTVADWVQSNRARAIGRRYLATLEQSGVVGADASSRGSTDGMHIKDHERATAAVDRFRSVAQAGDSADVDVTAVALAALADAAGLTEAFLGGRSNKRARERLSDLTARRTGTVPEPDRTALAILRFAVRTMKELAQQKHDGNGSGFAPIPVDLQYAVKNAAAIAAYANPNIPN